LFESSLTYADSSLRKNGPNGIWGSRHCDPNIE